MIDLIGGQVQTMIETAPAAQPHIRSGKLRALATTTREPVPTLPGIPTAAESGLEGFEVSSMFGVVAPAGTPEAVSAKLSSALKTIMAMPDVRDREESNKWKRLIKEARIQVE
jgi:tripartite-type tricarboxylate transporter receptor subunit TctC